MALSSRLSDHDENESLKQDLELLREELRRVEANRFARERQRAIDENDRERTFLRMEQTLGQIAADLAAVRSQTTPKLEQPSEPEWDLDLILSRMRDLRRSLTTRKCRLALVPFSDLKPVNGGRYNWTSTGRDPAFELTSRDPLPTGWCRISFELEQADQKAARPRLYVDVGEGFREHSSILLPRVRNSSVSTLVLLPLGVKGLRFDPTNRSGAFFLGPVVIEELGRYDTARAMLGPYFEKFSTNPARIVDAMNNAVMLFRAGGVDQLAQRLREKALSNLQRVEDYADWIEAYDTLDDIDRAQIRTRIATMKRRPLMSIVMPVYNPPVRFLRRAIETVRSQLYEQWELCIADDASPNPEVRAVLSEFARIDPRIKVHFRQKNGHISAASNSALELATGELTVLMDHDDELPEHALYFVLEEFNAHPDAGVIYSDEDKMDERGVRRDPYFKCDWNPDLLYSHNLISHLGVYRTELVRAVGGFRLGYEGSQDYDLALRVTEHLSPDRIRHIPRVLYHWRAIEGSTALRPDQKSYAEVAARKAIQSHFDRVNIKAKIEPGPASGLHRARYELPEALPLVSIVIPTRDGLRLLRRCIDSIMAKTSYASFEIIVVDNGSSDRQTLSYLRELQDHGSARVLRYPGPFNYSAINNLAASTAKGELLAFLNNDLEVINPEWLSEMVTHAVRSEIGVVGAKLYFPDDTIQHAGLVVGMGVHGVAGTPHRGAPRSTLGYFGKASLLQSFSAVTAACMLVRAETFNAVGGFNEKDLAVAFNDVDLCLRIREKGLRILWTPYAELYHYESSTRGTEDTPEKRARFAREVEAMKSRHGAALAVDPYYNPNLTLEADDFALAWPPRVDHPWVITSEKLELPGEG